MHVHPAPPSTLMQLVDAFEETVRSVITLGRDCSPADFERPTACPGWTVKDHLSHVAGLEAFFIDGVQPDVTLPAYDHVGPGVPEFMELFVEERRPRAGAEVVAELEAVLARRLTALRDPSLTLETPVPGLRRPGPAGSVLRLRLSDVWVHGQDLREALARPGDHDSGGATTFVAVVLSALPEIVTEAKVAAGQSVVLDVTGPVVGRAGVRTLEGEDGRPRAEDADDDLELAGDPACTTVALSSQALTRRGAGRVPAAELSVTVTGDEAVARRVLEHLAVTP